IAAASPAPVYGLVETFVGLGIVGGVVQSYQDQGRLLAEQIRQVATGVPPAAAVVAVPDRCVTDANALRRWSLSESRVPDSCEVRFAAQPFWREYPLQTFG